MFERYLGGNPRIVSKTDAHGRCGFRKTLISQDPKLCNQVISLDGTDHGSLEWAVYIRELKQFPIIGRIPNPIA